MKYSWLDWHRRPSHQILATETTNLAGNISCTKTGWRLVGRAAREPPPWDLKVSRANRPTRSFGRKFIFVVNQNHSDGSGDPGGTPVGSAAWGRMWLPTGESSRLPALFQVSSNHPVAGHSFVSSTTTGKEGRTFQKM